MVGNYAGQLSARGESLTLRNPAGLSFATTNYSGLASDVQQSLRLTEIMYHPPALIADTYPNGEYEFVELKNISSSTTLNLGGVRFTEGIQFTFPDGQGSQLLPRATVLVVKNVHAFTARYGNALPVAGQYQGSLEDQGERIQLLDSTGEEVLDFSYGDHWYPVTDGLGFSLIAVDEFAAPESWNLASQWREGQVIQGSPGKPEGERFGLPPVMINEVLSRDDTSALSDRIELFNPTGEPVSIGGWFLTDDLHAPKKFRFPPGTVLEPGGFLVLAEAEFNVGGGGFALSGAGDEAWLFSGDAQTNLTGYLHGFRFGAAERGVSFGRMVNSAGQERFVAQAEPTLGRTNFGPRVGPIVISEIHYHPSRSAEADPTRLTAWDILLGRQQQAATQAADQLEFIELQNITPSAVPLFLPSDPSQTWRLRGDVDFDFPHNITLGPGATALLVNFDPAGQPDALVAFRAAHGLAAGALILGPYAGRLDNAGARVELQKPDVSSAGGVAYVLVDSVDYGFSAPWPEGADGRGLSLQRRLPARFGDDPAQWVAILPSPGRPLVAEGIAPLITAQPQSQTQLAGQNILLSVGASGGAPLRYQWRFNGEDLRSETNAQLELEGVGPGQAGVYQVLVFNQAGSLMSSLSTVALLYPPSLLVRPQSVSVRPGSNVVLSVVAYGTAPLAYQWRKEGNRLVGASAPYLNLTNVQLGDGGSYTVEVSDAIGSVSSAPAELTLLINPVIVQHPLSQSIVPGATLVLSVSVTNNATLPIGYRLRRNNVTLPISPTNYVILNERTAYFTLSGANTMLPWTNYSIVVTNVALPTGNTSAPAKITYLADSDHDGLPDQWEKEFFGSATAADAGQDRDGDGLTATEEYLAGTDPTDSLSFLRVDLVAVPNQAVLHFSAVANRSYTLQFANSPAEPSWRTLARIPPQSINRLEAIADPAWTTNRYYRLRAE